MRFLIFQHTSAGGPGRLGPFLSDRRIDVSTAHVYEPGPIADPAQYDALVILGGPMSVHDYPRLAYLLQEERAVRQAVTEQVPCLGICLGAQILAKALGAEVQPNAVREVGFHPVRLTEAGARDPLFQGFPIQATVFHWHSDVCALPADRVLLAGSELCSTQAFRVGETTYGVQFHPEVTRPTIAAWAGNSRSCTPEEKQSMIEESAQLEAQLQRQAETLFLNFLAIAQGR